MEMKRINDDDECEAFCSFLRLVAGVRVVGACVIPSSRLIGRLRRPMVEVQTATIRKRDRRNIIS